MSSPDHDVCGLSLVAVHVQRRLLPPDAVRGLGVQCRAIALAAVPGSQAAGRDMSPPVSLFGWTRDRREVPDLVELVAGVKYHVGIHVVDGLFPGKILAEQGVGRVLGHGADSQAGILGAVDQSTVQQQVPLSGRDGSRIDRLDRFGWWRLPAERHVVEKQPETRAGVDLRCLDEQVQADDFRRPVARRFLAPSELERRFPDNAPGPFSGDRRTEKNPPYVVLFILEKTSKRLDLAIELVVEMDEP